MERTVYLTVITSSNEHCSNDCLFIDINPNEDGSYNARCVIFDADLKWDKRKREHGYKRALECRQNDITGVKLLD